ncbi:MAG: substrate-binding domain-containing protein [Phycisphaeraceae bacterium]
MPVSPLPKYEQVKQALIKEIRSGRWESGNPFPSESQLLQKFDVSRPTLIRSLQDLVREGYLYRKQGQGTFIADEKPEQKEAATLIPVFVSAHVAKLTGDKQLVELHILEGIQAGLAEAGANPQDVVVRHATPGRLDGATRAFIDDLTIGTALVIEPSYNRPLWDHLGSKGWNAWSLNEAVPAGNCVYVDQTEAGYIATKHLIDAGRQRIALLNGPLDQFWGFGARLDGYLRALDEAGLSYDERLVRQADKPIDSEAGRAMMADLLKLDQRPDAVVGVSDAKAMGAIAAAQEAGLTIPDDLMFTSIDNTLAERSDVPLSAVSMPFHEVGRRAAIHAVKADADRKSQESSVGDCEIHTHICLKPSLVKR